MNHIPIRPLQLAVPEHELDDLRDRLRRARLPEAETVSISAGVAGWSQGPPNRSQGPPNRSQGPPNWSQGPPNWSQGPPRAYIAELVRYWAEEYDWRRLEAELNAHGQGLTEIDGLDIHFLHIRSERPDAQPLVLTHGWPSSIIEPLEVIDALVAPASDDQPAFHVVAPSLPGFAFSGKPAVTGWTVARTADAWVELMARLGYNRFFAAGGDWGGRVTAALASRHRERVRAIHTFTPYIDALPSDTSGLSEVESGWVADTRAFLALGGGYSLEQSTRPQAIGYSLVDSPVGLLAWILDKFALWTDSRGNVESAISRDRILDTVTLYWLTATGGSSARFYWQNYPPDNSDPITVPTGVTIFPADIEKLPRQWVEARFNNLQYWHVAERGGHFPMLEVPTSYVDEIRRALGPMTD